MKQYFRFSVTTVLCATLLVALIMDVITHSQRRVRKTKHVYKLQQAAIDEAIDRFIAELESSGQIVTNDSIRVGGSGEWLSFVALTSEGGSQIRSFCLVEVSGSVTHDENDTPNWLSVFPIQISESGSQLDKRFTEILLADFKSRGWSYRESGTLVLESTFKPLLPKVYQAIACREE